MHWVVRSVQGSHSKWDKPYASDARARTYARCGRESSSIAWRRWTKRKRIRTAGRRQRKRAVTAAAVTLRKTIDVVPATVEKSCTHGLPQLCASRRSGVKGATGKGGVSFNSGGEARRYATEHLACGIQRKACEHQLSLATRNACACRYCMLYDSPKGW